MKADDIHINGSQQYVERNDIVDFLKSHLNTFLYSQIDEKIQNRNKPDKIFNNNSDFWRHILNNECHPEQIIKLQKFHLTEWIPISPGLFYTEEAERGRKAAQRNALHHNKESFQSILKSS